MSSSQSLLNILLMSLPSGSWKNAREIDHPNPMAKTWKLFKGKSVFHGPEPPKHPTPCTRWGRRPSSTRARLSFGPGRHPRTRNTPNSGFSLGQEGDDVLLNLKGFHHGSVPSERLTILVEQNLERKSIEHFQNDKRAKLRRHASWVYFAKIHFRKNTL